jgi:HEAT repeat protein
VSRAGTVAFRERSQEPVSVSVVEELCMDIQVLTLDARRELGQALVEKLNDRDPWPGIYAADRRLTRLSDYARRHAAEAAGITFISPDQLELPMPDGCGRDGQAG